MTAFLPDTWSRVLEIGCGTGTFADCLPGYVEYWGVEIDPGAASVAGKRLTRVLAGSYEDVAGDLPQEYFDLIVCNDVIEHMLEPDRFLRSLITRLVPSGTLVGSVPNVRYFPNLWHLLIDKEWRYEDEGILDSTHVRFFTERSLRRLLDECGLRVERMHGINSIIGPMGSVRAALIGLAVIGFDLATLGRHHDTRYLQFGFRSRRGAAR